MFNGFSSDKKVLNELDSIQKKTKKSFSNVKKEFEEHLEAINENTSEIQTNYELITKLEAKIDKIEHSLADINRFIKQFRTQHVYFLEEDEQSTFTIDPLTSEEKRLFKAIYELEAEGVEITYELVSQDLGVSVSLIREYVASIIEKGVPLIKQYRNQRIYLSMEPAFREVQTRQNIIGI